MVEEARYARQTAQDNDLKAASPLDVSQPPNGERDTTRDTTQELLDTLRGRVDRLQMVVRQRQMNLKHPLQYIQ